MVWLLVWLGFFCSLLFIICDLGSGWVVCVLVMLVSVSSGCWLLFTLLGCSLFVGLFGVWVACLIICLL